MSRSCKFALVFLCIELMGFLVVADEGSDYLDRKEQDVEEIVRLAITNAGQQCELLAACDNPTNCSHDACSMEHTGGSECMDGFNNYFCRTSTNTSCNSMNLDFSRSYTRNAESTNLNIVDSMLAICSQKPLEPLFKRISNASVLTRAYFAAVTGSYRVYPGTPQNADDCRRFDPRIRPWYRTATSVVKIVVVLIDLGASMGNNLPPDLGAGTIFQAAENMAKALLRTMSAQDYVNIIMFDSSRERNGTVSIETLDVLISELDKQSVEGQSRQSNISAAILAALPIFDANPKAAKVFQFSIYIDTLGNITAQVKQALQSRITGYSLAAPKVVLSAANCRLVNETLQPCGRSTAYYAEDGGLFKGDDSRRRTMQELMCCGTCSAPPPPSESGGVSRGAIVGIVVGGVVGIAVLVLLIWLREPRRRRKTGDRETQGVELQPFPGGPDSQG